MFTYQFNETTVKDFYTDREVQSNMLLLPGGTQLVHDAGVWGLYHNEYFDVSFIITKAKSDGALGWRVRVIPGIVSLSYADTYVKQRCGECLGLR